MLRRVPLLAVLCAVAALTSVAYAADEAMVLRMSAERLAAENRCDEAIERARRARELAPDDAEAPAIEGRCLLQLKRYPEAVSALQASRKLDANNPETAIELLMAHYHGGDRAAAESALADAKRLAPDDARVSLYEGLILMQRSENQAAAEALERAGQLDPAADPYASYYAGIAWQQAQDRKRAREALERARQRAGDGVWAAEADRALANLNAGGDSPRFWVRLEGGMEYDDNVVLRGDEIAQPSDISGDADWRGVWSLIAGTEFFRTRDWATGFIAAYQGSAHIDLNQFDIAYPSGSLYLDRRVDDASFVRFAPYGGYVWTDVYDQAQDYLAHVGGELSYYRGFHEAGSGRLWGRVGYQDYLFPQHDDSEHAVRDGMQYLIGYDHALPVFTGSTTLRGGVLGGTYVAQGRDYDSHTAAFNAGVHQLLPWKFEADLSGGYAYEYYDHESSFKLPEDHTDRIDKILTAAAELERPITSWLSISGRYRYINNESNTKVFDYDRHIAGGYFTVYLAK
jgi:Flp pilus assembly protein TadD